MLTTILLLASQAATPTAGGEHVFAVAATDVQVAFALPEFHESAERIQLLRRSEGDRLMTAADLGSPDVRLRLLGGPAGTYTSAEWLRIALGERAAGVARFEIGPYAASEEARALKLPYRELDRHAFLVAGGAAVEVHVCALEHEEPERYGRARFEAIVRSARFAIVRRAAREDLPERYFELSHAACVHADGLAWLDELATAPEATWIELLACVEHALAARSNAPTVAERAQALLALLDALPEPDRAQRAARVLALDALGLCAARAGDVERAAAHLSAALERAESDAPAARWGITADLGLACAAAQDAAGAVRHLRAAFAAQPALKGRTLRDPLLDAVRSHPEVAELLKDDRKLAPDRRLGRQ